MTTELDRDTLLAEGMTEQAVEHLAPDTVALTPRMLVMLALNANGCTKTLAARIFGCQPDTFSGTVADGVERFRDAGFKVQGRIQVGLLLEQQPRVWHVEHRGKFGRAARRWA